MSKPREVMRQPAPKGLRPEAPLELTRTHYMPGTSYHAHSHEHYEFFWLQQGALRHVCNGLTDEVGPGSIHCIRPGDFHTLLADTAKGCDLVNVVIHRPFAEALREQHPYLERLWPRNQGATPHAVVAATVSQMEVVHFWLERVEQRALQALAATGLILSIAALQAPSQADQPVPGWLKHASESFCQYHLRESVDRFIHLTGHSPRYVNRVVQAHYALSTTDYVNRLKIEQAGLRLGNSQDPILDIAFQCGYENISYFYRVFKRYKGLTPKAFRSKYSQAETLLW